MRSEAPRSGPVAKGFTIVEVVVATAVLSLLLVLLAQVLNQTVTATRATRRQMDTAGTARNALDALATDLQNLVADGTTTILVRWRNMHPELAFATRGRGPAGAPSTRYLAVSWSVAPDGTVVRSYEPIPWDATDLLAAIAAAANPSPAGGSDTVGPGVVASAITLALADGSLEHLDSPLTGASSWQTTSDPGGFHGRSIPAGWSALHLPVNASAIDGPPVTALGWCLATMDDQSRSLPGATELGRQLPASFATDESPGETWTASIANGELSGPAPALRSLRVDERLIPLPN